MAECGREVPVKEVYTEDSGEVPTYWHDYTDVQMRVLNEGVWFAGRYLSYRGHRGTFGRDIEKGGPGTGTEGGGLDSVLLILGFEF